jgi:hypothetical protein
MEFKQGVGEEILCDEARSGRPVSYNLYVEKCSCKNVILHFYTIYMAWFWYHVFQNKHTIHRISGSDISPLRNSWWAPVIQPIHNLWYYHFHINHWLDQRVSLTQHCQAVHYDHCPGLLIFHTHLSADRVPNTAAQNALSCLIQWLVDMDRIPSNYQLTGHRNVGATSCPGNALFNEIWFWPSFTPCLA